MVMRLRHKPARSRRRLNARPSGDSRRRATASRSATPLLTKVPWSWLLTANHSACRCRITDPEFSRAPHRAHRAKRAAAQRARRLQRMVMRLRHKPARSRRRLSERPSGDSQRRANANRSATPLVDKMPSSLLFIANHSACRCRITDPEFSRAPHNGYRAKRAAAQRARRLQ